MSLSVVVNGEDAQIVVSVTTDGMVTLQFHDSDEFYSLTKHEAEMLASVLRNFIFKG